MRLMTILLIGILVSGVGFLAPDFSRAVNANEASVITTGIITSVIPILEGTRYKTQAYIYESNNPGPAVMVVGGVHGNEPAGSLAADKIRQCRPVKGTLIVIPRANNLALQEGVRTLPEITDINRAYPGVKDGNPAQRIAYEIGGLMKKYKISMLIDLHEARTFHRYDKSSLGQTILYGKDDKSTLLALDTVEYMNQQITEKHKKFTFLATPIKGSTAYYASVFLGIPAFTMETSREQPLEERVNQHFLITQYLLQTEGLLAR